MILTLQLNKECTIIIIITILFVIIWLDNKAQSALKVAQQYAIKSKT